MRVMEHQSRMFSINTLRVLERDTEAPEGRKSENLYKEHNCRPPVASIIKDTPRHNVVKF